MLQGWNVRHGNLPDTPLTPATIPDPVILPESPLKMPVASIRHVQVDRGLAPRPYGMYITLTVCSTSVSTTWASARAPRSPTPLRVKFRSSTSSPMASRSWAKA